MENESTLEEIDNTIEIHEDFNENVQQIPKSKVMLIKEEFIDLIK